MAGFSITRRAALAGGTASLILPRFAIAQADNRPSITVAVQKVSNTNTLDVLREQSNVGERVFFSSLWEGLIGRNWLGQLETVPGLATEWRRIDDRTVELKLRKGVKFHNGDELTAEDVAFSFGRQRMFGDTQPTAGKTIAADFSIGGGRASKELPPEVPALLVTAESEYVAPQLARHHGFSGHWTKPLDVAATLRSLDHWLARG